MVLLGLLNGRLVELTGREPPGYPRALRAAVDGVLPAVRIGGRWYVADRDLDAAAAVLGMAAPARRASASRRPK